MSDGWSSILWQCPYVRYDRKQELHCEGGVLRMVDRKTYLRYIHQYCASAAWGCCTLAQALNEYYEGDD